MTWLPRHAHGGAIPREARYPAATVPLRPAPAEPTPPPPEPIGGPWLRTFVAVVAVVDIPLGVAAALVEDWRCLWITALGVGAFAATRVRGWWTP